MKPRKTPDLGEVTDEIVARLGQDCELLERFSEEPGSRQNPFETMLESLLTKTALPSRSPPHFSPRELRERSFGRLARAGFDTPVKRKKLAEALVSAGLIRRMTLAWLGATRRGTPSRNLGRMFEKGDEGGRIVGLPAYGAELARQIYNSPALLRRYLESDEQAFVVLMEKQSAHPTLLNMPSMAVLLVSIYASNAS